MPILDIMVGIAGSGKSSYVQNVLLPLRGRNSVVVSSDEIRETSFGDINDQTHNAEVFQKAHQMTRQALQNGQNVIFDATSMSVRSRRGIMAQTRGISDVRSQCHVILSSPEQAFINQQRRGRSMDFQRVVIQMASFSVPNEELEGFTDTTVYYKPFDNPDYMDDLMKRLYKIEQTSKWHQENAGEHTQMVVQYTINHGYPPYLCEAAKYHDIGKVYTQTKDANGYHFFNHSRVGAYLYLFGKARPYRFASMNIQEYRIRIAKLIQLHDEPCHSGFRLERFQEQYGREVTKDIMLLHEADKAGAIRNTEENTIGNSL